MNNILKEIYGLDDKKETKEEKKEEEEEEEFTEGAVNWETEDVKPWHYKATIDDVIVRVKKRTVGNKVIHFEVPGDRFIDFKIMNTEGDEDIEIIDDEKGNPTVLTWAETENGPFYNFSLVREDENVWFKESIILEKFPPKIPATLVSYKIQMHNLDYIEEGNGITFYDPSSKEAFFSMQKPYLIVEDGEERDLFKYEIRKEGINVFLDLVMVKSFPTDSNLEFYEIDPTIYTTEKGTLGRTVKIYNETLINGVFLISLLAGFLILYKLKDKISGKEKKERMIV